MRKLHTKPILEMLKKVQDVSREGLMIVTDTFNQSINQSINQFIST